MEIILLDGEIPAGDDPVLDVVGAGLRVGRERGDLRRLAAKSPASSHSPVIRNRATIDRIRPILMAIRTTELFISLPVLPGALEQGLEHLVEGDDLRVGQAKRDHPSFWISLK